MREFKMKSHIFLKKYLLAFTIIVVGLTGQIAYAAYDNVNITATEMNQFSQAFANKKKAERTRKKKYLMLQQRKRQLEQRYKRQRYARQHRVVKPVYNRSRRIIRPRHHTNASIPAWRKATAQTMTRNENNALFDVVKRRNLPRLKQLVAKGANIHHTNFSGESLLHVAASLGDMRMVQYLLSQGANVNIRTGKNWLPIHHAMRFNHPVVANYLIAHHAALRMKNTDGFSALDFAARSKNARIKAIAKHYGR